MRQRRRVLVFLHRRRCLQLEPLLPPGEMQALLDPLLPLPPDPWRHCALRRLDLCGATILRRDMEVRAFVALLGWVWCVA